MRRFVLISSVLWVVFVTAASPAGAQFRLPPDTRLMTDDELALFFGDRSWIREKSVGYFSEDASGYVAASNDGGAARGRWSLPGAGKLCISAWWSAAGKFPRPARDCYSHRTDGIRVFQKREPDGAWAIFKDAPPAEWPATNRLVPSNYFTMPVNLLAK